MTKIFISLMLLFTFTALFFTNQIQSTKTIQITPTIDCSPEYSYKTNLEEQTYCQLQNDNPNCQILEDLSKFCK